MNKKQLQKTNREYMAKIRARFSQEIVRQNPSRSVLFDLFDAYGALSQSEGYYSKHRAIEINHNQEEE